MKRLSSWRLGSVALLVDALFLLGTISFALHIPSTRTLDSLPEDAVLDYSAFPAADFAPLTSDFIERVLGITGGPTQAKLASLSPTPGTNGTSVWPVARGDAPRRTVLSHPDTNDDFDDAITVTSVPFTAQTDARHATRQGGEPAGCSPVGGTLWYRYRPTRDVGLLANSFGSDHPVAIGVFRGPNLDELTLIDDGCDFDSSGNAHVVFKAQKNRSYFFQVAAPVTGGDLVFNLDPLGTTRVVAVTQEGKAAAGTVERASVSAQGRYVAFEFLGPSLVRRPVHECTFEGQYCRTIYVRDMATGRIEIVSKNSRGAPANSSSFSTAISSDGRYVAFMSWADNLVPNDSNRAADVFVHDRLTNRTERVSVSSSGREGTSPWSDNPYCHAEPQASASTYRTACAYAMADYADGSGLHMSADGRYVVYSSALHGLVKPEPPHCTDLTGADYQAHTNHGPGIPLPIDVGQYACRQVYIHDLKTGATRLASVSSSGETGRGDSAGPFVSPNGKWVVFSSSADELVEGDTNDTRDVFRHNLQTGETELVSVSAFGVQGNGQSGGAGRRGHASISNNGRWVAFMSHATSLTEETGDETDGLFIKDMRSGEMIAVTTSADSSAFTQTDPFGGMHSSISADGRYIACTSGFRQFESGDLGQEILVYDRVTRTMTVVSVSSSGQPARTEGNPVTFSGNPEISADGHFVIFESGATNLDDKDKDGAEDLDAFIHALPWAR